MEFIIGFILGGAIGFLTGRGNYRFGRKAKTAEGGTADEGVKHPPTDKP